MVLLELHSLSIALLDWTIKQKRQNSNMRICSKFSVKCEASDVKEISCPSPSPRARAIHTRIYTRNNPVMDLWKLQKISINQPLLNLLHPSAFFF